MIEMNPYYAHDSEVGPVFDVAHWSRGKNVFSGMTTFIFGAVIASAMVLAWKPTLVWEKPPKVVRDIHKETLKLEREHKWVAYGGTAVAGLFGYVALVGSCALLIDAAVGSYYFRAGPHGLSFHVPNGLDWLRLGLVFRELRRDVPYSQIKRWEVVQHRRLGALSRNVGNIMAFFKLETMDGKKEEFNLDCFREPAYLIYERIQQAAEMVPADLQPDTPPLGDSTGRPMEHVELG